MSDTAIRVENLGKKYRLRHVQQGLRYKAFRDLISDVPRNIFSKFFGRKAAEKAASSTVEDFWALEDISFEIGRGEAVGIVGRNGAGKSTLLKLLSRITEPTTGRIHLEGRMASLLEVGTGFHPELTGRENIFLNGAILGMTRAEIKRQFDSIVAFSDVERFLDTPVKRYSSGMYMRLAFAVAAHLESEILIVDEVLAVGDMEFQKKCLGKMEDVTKSGRTVLFVSHNLDAVLRLCKTTIHLAGGRLAQMGPTSATVAQYLASQVQQSARILFPREEAHETSRGNLVLISAEWPHSNENPPWTVPYGEEIAFTIHFECRQAVDTVELGIALYAPTGTEIASTSSISGSPAIKLTPGNYAFQVTYRSFHLIPNHYAFGIGMKSSFGMEDYHPKAFSVDVTPSLASSETKADTFRGYVVPNVEYVLI